MLDHIVVVVVIIYVVHVVMVGGWSSRYTRLSMLGVEVFVLVVVVVLVVVAHSRMRRLVFPVETYVRFL